MLSIEQSSRSQKIVCGLSILHFFFTEPRHTVKIPRINERATALLRKYAIKKDREQTVYGPALWTSPEGDLCKNDHRTINGSTILRVLIAQDMETRAAQMKFRTALQVNRDRQVSRVSKTKVRWLQREHKWLFSLAPWLVQANRALEGTASLVVHDYLLAIQCIAAIKAHAERTTAQGSANLFGATISITCVCGVKYYRTA